jgi:2-deoxy-scyllo-inosamine dehydrogenase (SAM-dependent)
MTDILKDTTNIAFELSNTCQLACHHKRCPLSLEMVSPFRVKSPVHLDARIAYNTFDILGKYDYSEEISFHQYNEPLIDPRLFFLVHEARKRCPYSKRVILTNGLNLSEQLAIELKEVGVTHLWVTRYGSDEDKKATEEYVKNVIVPIFGDDNSGVLPWHKLDGRITIYDPRPTVDYNKNCYAPLCTIVITRNADVGLCCYDWRRTVTFGNLKENTLEEILRLGEMQYAYNDLKKVVPFR